jgi:TRAP-type C4-dicarboxylate transport system permease small subunit
MLRALDRAVEALLGLIAVALIATAFGQVVARYVFSRPFTWVLELGVLLVVWAAMLAGYLGVRRNAHMAVDMLVARASAANRRRIALVNQALCMMFVGLCGWKSLDVIEAMQGMRFTSIPLELPVMYWALPAGCGLMLVALAAGVPELLRGKR